MIIADCRQKYTKNAYPYGTQCRRSSDISADEINPYWEGNLCKENKICIQGYDCAVEEIRAFFDNIEDYAPCEGYSDAQDEEKKNLCQAIKAKLDEYLECQRDEIITSLIENQEDNGGR